MEKLTRRNIRHNRSKKSTARLRSQRSDKAGQGMQGTQPPGLDVTYEIVQHDGGWAYKVNGVFSEPYPTHAEALAAAQSAAEEQEIPGEAETIEYEDDKGEWHSETVSGRDRPHAVVKTTKN